jgi:hypothetical protein
LSVFLHHHLDLGEQKNESAQVVVKELLAFWARARIPTQRPDKIQGKILALHDRWRGLKKSEGRRSTKQEENEQRFSIEMKNLFDVAHADALCMITIQEDRDFLLAQREPGRRGTMGSVDESLTRKEVRSLKRKEAGLKQREKEKDQAEASSSRVELASSSSASTASTDSEESTQEELLGAVGGVSPPKRSRAKNVWTPALTSALDRTRSTDRDAVFLVATTAKSLGHDPVKLNISRSSVKRHRERNRREEWTALKNAFKEDGETCVVHWDGKLLPTLQDSTKKSERLPVLVTALTSGKTQLLGVPQLASGSGENQAAAVYALLDEWNLAEKVAGLSFDTTASNSGRLSGAAHLLEQKLGRILLNLACRHHVYELMLKAVFETLAGSSTGPDVGLFHRFQKQWNSLDRGDFQTGWDTPEIRPLLEGERNDLLDFALSKLSVGNFRDDYREYLELVVIFLGGTVPRFTFKQPGAFHHARWMSKVIYSLKIWLFRGQLSLTKRDLKCVREVSTFAVLVYMKPWFGATDAAAAPRTDLDVLEKLRSYYNPKVGQAAAGKLENHLWYLSEHLVGLALFDPKVPAETKQAMAVAMEEDDDEDEGDEDVPKRIHLKKGSAPPKLETLATPRARELFRHLGVNPSFLGLPPDEWEHHPEYKKAKERVTNTPVVNDHAERGVALIQQFNGSHTKKDEQLQFLLGVVAEHRKRFPVASKVSLTTGLQ